MRQIHGIPLLLALALSLSLTLPAAAAETEPLLPDTRTYAGQFADLEDAWCREEAIAVYETGLMNGRTDTRFDIQGSLTCAQITVIAARLQDLLAGGDGVLEPAAPGEAWYAPALRALASSADEEVQYVLKQFAQSPESYPDAACTRRTFALMVAGILTEPLPAINAVARVPDSTDPQVLMLYNAGVLTGNDRYGTFGANDTLNRGQAAAILARLADPSLRRTVTPEPFDLCADVLGLEADSQALSITYGDTAAELSLDIVAPTLCEKLLEQYNADQVLPDTIDAFQADMALTILAGQQGISVSEAELEEAYGPVVPGYRGRSDAAQQWDNTHALLQSRLLSAYNAQYGSENWGSSPSGPAETSGSIRLQSDLDAVKAAMTVTLSDALSSLDLTAVYQRLLASPFPLWNF